MSNKKQHKKHNKILKNNEYSRKSSLILDVLKNEYEIEIERGKTIESKSGIFLALVGVIITFVPSIFSKVNLKHTINNNYIEIAFSILLLLLIICTLVLLIVSAIFLTMGLVCKPHGRIGISVFGNDFLKYEENSIKDSLIEAYTKVINEDKKINSFKAKNLNRGIYFLIASLIIFVLLIIMFLFV